METKALWVWVHAVLTGRELALTATYLGCKPNSQHKDTKRSGLKRRDGILKGKNLIQVFLEKPRHDLETLLTLLQTSRGLSRVGATQQVKF